jgi:hypothetical protein
MNSFNSATVRSNAWMRARSGNGIRCSRDGSRLVFSQWDHSHLELWELAILGRNLMETDRPDSL